VLRRTRLWIVPVWFCAVDAAVTLVGQSSAYWSGERGEAYEANPLGLCLLWLHPLAFAGGAAASLLLYVLLIERLPQNLARLASFVILFLHALGAATWFVRLGLIGYAVAAGWLLIASWLLGWSWRK
jgi:hypothetical protein